MTDYAEIIYEVRDPVATITLNRPERLNAWTDRMAAEVRHAVARAEADAAVVGIVITGAGRAFCAGADLGTLDAISQGGRFETGAAEELELPDRSALPPDFAGEYTYLLACPKPIIAAINGAVAGMAVPIALCCDVRFMAEDAPLVTAFVQRGLVAEWGLSWLLPRIAGTGVALDLLFTSRKMPGSEAAQRGIVNAALPATEVLPHAQRYVEQLAASSSPASMAVMKRQVYAQMHAGLGAAEAEARQLMVESFQRPDFNEGVQSFLEKRPAKFGRLTGEVPSGD